jgi:hypothetical protein
MNIIAKCWIFSEAINHDVKTDPLFKGVKYIETFTTILDQIYIAEFEDEIIICGHGTLNNKAWLSDFTPFPLGEGEIHQGFYDGWAHMKPYVDNYFRTLLGTSGDDFSSCTKKVYFTGHSRGSVMATLGARHLAKNRNLKSYNINFGCPAMFTEKGREEYNFLPIWTTRVVNAWDIVPNSHLIDIAFKHVGNLEHINTNGTGWHDWFQWRRVMDHFYSEYTKSLINYCKDKKDQEGVDALKETLKRARP